MAAVTLELAWTTLTPWQAGVVAVAAGVAAMRFGLSAVWLAVGGLSLAESCSEPLPAVYKIEIRSLALTNSTSFSERFRPSAEARSPEMSALVRPKMTKSESLE